MQEVLQNILIQMEVINAALLSLMHIQLCYLLLCFFIVFIYWPDGGLKKWLSHLTLSLPLHDFPFPFSPSPGWESFSSMREVLLMMTGKAWNRISGILISLPSRPCCVWATQPGGSHQGSLTELWIKKRKGKENKNKTTPSLSFLKLKEKLRDGTASNGDPDG